MNITAKHSSDVSGAVKIRKAWVLQTSDDKLEELKSAKDKFEYYKQIDHEVQMLWAEKLAEVNKQLEDIGLNKITLGGIKVWPKEKCVSVDELLLEAAKEVAETL